MNCDFIADNAAQIVYGQLSPEAMSLCQMHLRGCSDCTDAVRGAEALALLRNCGPQSAPEGLFDTMTEVIHESSQPQDKTHSSFWAGTGLGGAVAASFFAAAMMAGWIGPTATESEDIAQFAVAVSEPTVMNVAIEVDRPLNGASISILMSGEVELDGFSGQRELSWVTDLEEGVNRLQLPVIALDPSGGKMIVRLEHPETEQVYVVNVDGSA